MPKPFLLRLSICSMISSFCADVNASRWLVQYEDDWIGGKPSCHHHFLLVAARELSSLVVRARRLYSQGFNQLIGDLLLLFERKYLNTPLLAWRARMMFSRIESSANIPSFFLSSEQKPIPAIIALRGDVISVFFPFICISPWSAMSIPKISRPSQSCPSQEDQPSPSTSPSSRSMSKGDIELCKPSCLTRRTAPLSLNAFAAAFCFSLPR